MSRVAVLLFVSGTLALAGPPTSPSTAQTARSLTVVPATGLVGGDVVTLAGSGFEPNSGVFFCERDLAGPFNETSCGNGGVIPSGVTADGNGAFSIPVTAFRFITPASNGLSIIDCAQPGATCGFGAANVFTGRQIIGASASITFTPQPPATGAIRGSVTGPDGQALAGVAVWAYTFSDSWVGSLQTVSDGNGAYQLDISPNRVTYAVRFGPPGGTDLIPQWFDNQTRRSSATPPVFPFEFNDLVITLANQQLAAGGAIAGVVTDGSGTGVSGVTVWAYGPGDTWVGSFGSTTSADGSYRIGGVRPADYKVRFMPPSASGLAIEWYDNAALHADAKSVTVTEGSTATGIDAQLSP
jgi:hypothetical protein